MKYSQEYVAKKCGVSRQAVSKWETNQSEPSMKNLIELADHSLHTQKILIFQSSINMSSIPTKNENKAPPMYCMPSIFFLFINDISHLFHQCFYFFLT